MKGKHMLPEIGLNFVPLHHDTLVEGAELAERLGFESIWMGEHILTPVHDDSQYPGEALPFEPDSPFLDPLVSLAHIAARTTRLRLGTGILMAPAREPFATIRALATLDALSGGRLDLGLGLGWSEEEFDVIGFDWSSRAQRMEDFIEVMTLLFGEGHSEFHGKTIDMPLMGFGPKSPQGRRPLVHLGGHTPRPLRRAALLADGWYGGSAAVPDAARHVETIRKHREAAGLSMEGYVFGLVMLHVPDRAHLEQLAAIGIDRVVITPWRRANSPAFPGDTRDLSVVETLAKTIGIES
jgi:probable F420-dependent oxidoreductase